MVIYKIKYFFLIYIQNLIMYIFYHTVLCSYLN